jgi:uncharacterized membrane protein/ribosomal protein S27E
VTVTCTKCGATVVGDAAFCVKCGNQLRPFSAPTGAHYCGRCGQVLPGAAAGSTREAAEEYGLPVSYAGPLCYLFGFVSGLVMFFLDKRHVVRFHAVQSTIVFGVLVSGLIVLGRLARNAFSDSSPAIYVSYFVAFAGVGLIALGIWILLIVKAFDRQPFHMPGVGRLADAMSGGGGK